MSQRNRQCATPEAGFIAVQSRPDEAEQVHGQVLAMSKKAKPHGRSRICRVHGITEQTYYRWKAKFGGMELSEIQRLKALQDEAFFASGSGPLAKGGQVVPTHAISR